MFYHHGPTSSLPTLATLSPPKKTSRRSVLRSRIVATSPDLPTNSMGHTSGTPNKREMDGKMKGFLEVYLLLDISLIHIFFCIIDSYDEGS